MSTQQYKTKKYISKFARHTKLRTPHMITAFKKILGTFSEKRILDVGCGEGTIAAELAKRGANVTGIDPEPKMIEEAKRNHSKIKEVEFSLGKAQNLRRFKKNSFDSVLITLVLVHIEKRAELAQIFKEAFRVLKKDGTLIFTDLHPACIFAPKNEFRWSSFEKNFSYLREGKRFAMHVKPDAKTSLTFHNVHWPLETYSDILREEGFCITHIIEPPSERKNYSKNLEVPSFIIFGCRKIK